MIKVFVVGGGIYYASPIKDVKLVNNLNDAQVVLFTGGEDISPELYNEKNEGYSYVSRRRDNLEREIFESIKPNQLVLGICRGSQFLCAMNGGKIVQDVTNHALEGTHQIVLDNSEGMEVTSTHHQMMYPFNLSKSCYTLLGSSIPTRSNHYYGGGINVENILKYGEPEIVLFHKKDCPKCLAIQGHPEMMLKTSKFVNWENNKLKELLNLK